jgi:hypothetical protein
VTSLQVQAVPVYVVDGLLICDPPSQQYEGEYNATLVVHLEVTSC